MYIDGEKWRTMLIAASKIWKNQRRHLCEIDAALGDGDHGVTMDKIGSCIEESLSQWNGRDIGGFMSGLGLRIMSIPGGSAASLYGMFLGGLCGPHGDGKDQLDAEDLKGILENALGELTAISTAAIGDKTMMDSLIPAIDAAKSTQGDIPAILKAATEAALEGAENTKKYPAKFGRAKNYKEKSIGRMDAGAVSMSMFFQGLYEGFTA